MMRFFSTDKSKDIIIEIVNGIRGKNDGVRFKTLVYYTEKEAISDCEKLFTDTPIAVMVKRPVIIESAKLQNAKNNLNTLIAKRDEKENPVFLEEKTTSTCSCENCGSKFIIEKLLPIVKEKAKTEGHDINKCPVCNYDFRSKLLVEKIAKYNDDIKKKEEEVELIEHELYKKAVQNKDCPTEWLVFWNTKEEYQIDLQHVLKHVVKDNIDSYKESGYEKFSKESKFNILIDNMFKEGRIENEKIESYVKQFVKESFENLRITNPFYCRAEESLLKALIYYVYGNDKFSVKSIKTIANELLKAINVKENEQDDDEPTILTKEISEWYGDTADNSTDDVKSKTAVFYETYLVSPSKIQTLLVYRLIDWFHMCENNKADISFEDDLLYSVENEKNINSADEERDDFGEL